MKKALKITGISFLALLIIIISLPFIFKGKIIEMVKEEANNMLNAKVDFGEFDMGLISTFPDFNFSIDNVKVEGVDKFEGIALADIKNLTLKVDLMSVISGSEINVKTINIESPIINAIVLADTTANWDIMKATEEEEEVVAAEEPSNFKLGLKDLTINNARIVYKDETMNLVTEIFGLNFNLSGDMTADFTSLKTKTTIDTLNLKMDGINYMKNAIVDATADIDADLANSKYTFKENEFKINELILGLDGFVAMPTEDIDMDIKFSAKKTDFKNILSMVPAVYMTDFANVKTAGKLALDGYAKGVYAENRLPAFALNLIVENAMFKYPDLPKSVNNIGVDLHITNVDGLEDHTVIDLKKFHMEMAGNPIDAKMLLKTPISDPDVLASLKAKIDLATLKDIMPLEKGDEMNGVFTSDVNIKGRMSSIEKERYEEFNAEGEMSLTNMLYKSDSLPYDVMLNQMGLKFSPQFVELVGFDAKIGKTDLQANGRIDNILSYVFSEDQVLTGRFNLSSANLDVNEFMSDSEEPVSTTTTEEEPLTVVEVPKNIDFTLNSTFTKIIYDNIQIDNVKGLLVVRDQKIDMQHLGMNLMDGSMVMDGFYETTNPTKPGIKFDMDIKDFDVQKVANTFNSITEMAPIVKNTHGKFNTTLKITGVLNDKMEPDLNKLNGGGVVQTKNIEVKDFKPMLKLADVLKNDKLKTVSVANTNVTYEIKDGRVYTKPFDVKLGNTVGTMSGSNGLDQTIDYTMALKIPSKDLGLSNAMTQMTSQASSLGLDIKAAEHINVDVLIGGTVTEPKISTNLKGAAKSIVSDVKEQVKEKINQEIDKAKEQAIAKAKEEAAKLVAEAKNQSDKLRAEGKKAGESLKAEADKQAKKLLDEAGGNFIKKKLAEETGKKLKETADKQAIKVEAEANTKADQIDVKAQEEADKLIAKAEAQK